MGMTARDWSNVTGTLALECVEVLEIEAEEWKPQVTGTTWTVVERAWVPPGVQEVVPEVLLAQQEQWAAIKSCGIS